MPQTSVKKYFSMNIIFYSTTTTTVFRIEHRYIDDWVHLFIVAVSASLFQFAVDFTHDCSISIPHIKLYLFLLLLILPPLPISREKKLLLLNTIRTYGIALKTHTKIIDKILSCLIYIVGLSTTLS